jgi:hypothetical protein
MSKQMDNGGYEALLYHLQNVDLTDYEVRKIPETEALQEQKLFSLGVEEEWWFNKLQEGRILPDHEEWKEEVMVDELVNDFLAYTDSWKISRRGNQTSLGRFLNRMIPHLSRVQRPTEYEYVEAGRVYKRNGRKYFYQLGSLQDCRLSWQQAHGLSRWEAVQIVRAEKKNVPF